MKDRIDFNIANNGISVGANVTRDYFEERVLPLITTLLVGMAPTQNRRASSKRPARPEPKESRGSLLTIKAVEQCHVATTAPDAMRAAAISSYSHKTSRKTAGTHILA